MDTNPATDYTAEQQAALSAWFGGVVANAYRLRGIATSKERAIALLAELERRRYNSAQAKIAEFWIMHSAFSETKKSNGLELNDFFPVADSLHKLLPPRARILDEPTLNALKREAYLAGYADGEAAARQGAKPQPLSENVEHVCDLYQALWAAEYSVSELERQLKRRDQRINELEYWLQRLHNAELVEPEENTSQPQ